MNVELVIALVIAIPIAVIITRIVMTATARHNQTAERWEHFCQMKK